MPFVSFVTGYLLSVVNNYSAIKFMLICLSDRRLPIKFSQLL